MLKEHVEDLYLEDHVPGSVYRFGSILVEEKEIVDFAKTYDPQVFHVDPEAAKSTSFGRRLRWWRRRWRLRRRKPLVRVAHKRCRP